MTYVLGVGYGTTNAIIADTMLTSPGGRGSGLKSGVLYPGCIYGYSGKVVPAMDYLAEVRRQTADVCCAVEGWKRLNDVTASYDFKPGGFFKLLLSSRHSGIPRFYLLDSATGCIEKVEESPPFVSIGRGKSSLDDFALALCHWILGGRHIEQASMLRPCFSDSDFAFLICLYLHAHAAGDLSQALAQVDTGGIFHFVKQTPFLEERQKPALYLLAGDSGDGMNYFWIKHRVAFEGDNLVLYTKPSGDDGYWAVMFPNQTDEEITSGSAILRKWNEQKDVIAETHIRQPPYHFFGAQMHDLQDLRRIAAMSLDVFDGNVIDADLNDHIDEATDQMLRIQLFGDLEGLMKDVRAQGPNVIPIPKRTTERLQWKPSYDDPSDDDS